MDKRSAYIIGIGVGLMFSSIILSSTYSREGPYLSVMGLAEFLLILGAIFIILAYVINTERGKKTQR